MMPLILYIFFYLNHSDSDHHYNCISLHMFYLLASIIRKHDIKELNLQLSESLLIKF